eukprot:3614475-Amphidinium_carterae.1
MKLDVKSAPTSHNCCDRSSCTLNKCPDTSPSETREDERLARADTNREFHNRVGKYPAEALTALQ